MSAATKARELEVEIADLTAEDAAPRRGIGEAYLVFLGLVLLGYATLGRGFAYVGVPPLYIGEIALGLGGVTLLASGSLSSVLALKPAWLLGALALWGFARTAPYVGDYGADALRDAAIWGYGGFAIVVAGVLNGAPRRIEGAVRLYGWFVILFLLALPAVFFIARLHPDAIPRMPGTDMRLGARRGDLLVHLAGVTAFIVLHLGRTSPLLWPVLLVDLGLAVSTTNRAGLLSFMTSLGVILFLKPRAGRAWLLVGILAVFLVLAAIGVFDTADGEGERVISKARSIVSGVEEQRLEVTKAWRLDWWTRIVDYTVFGDRFWTGKGFGVNLADDDDFQVEHDTPLRSPHNGHLTILARSGVPGIVLWLLVHGTFAAGMLSSYVRCRRRGDEQDADLFLFILAYFTAFIVNATFDVVLEGPMGGIWFWTIFGLGLGALAASRRAEGG